jgi:hypothetical protein
MTEANHLNYIIAMLRNKGDTDTADALESGKGDKDTVKRALNSIYGVKMANSGAKEVMKDV